MPTSEIEKLERRYAENPHGLTFAPLAEVHRKNGDIARALELLKVGLELHPNYIPASIVLGRCQQDLGDFPAAEEAFAHVLRLDDENVIALKSLADINERQDRLDEAERWLRRLVTVDRSNDEARQQLQRLEKARERSGRVAASVPKKAETEVPREVAQADEVVVEEPIPIRVSGPHAAPPDLEPIELTEEVQEPASIEPAAFQERKVEVPPEPVRLEPTTPELVKSESEAEPGRVAGLVPSEFEPPKVPPETMPLGIEIETESDILLRSSGASEFSVPDASQEFAALAAKLNAARPRTAGRRASDRVAAEQPAPPPPEKEEEPPPPRIEEPVAPPAPARAYAAQDTKGQSIAAFFQALLVARPPGNSGMPGPSSSARGASSTNPAPTEGAAPGLPKDGPVSFDDFFGSPAGGVSPLAPGSPEPGKDDLDQFHSWLQNLKR